MLDVRIDSLYRWGGLLRSSLVFPDVSPDVTATPPDSAAGAALEAWTASMRAAVDLLNGDLDRISAAVTASARNYEEVA
jgi:O-acetyl-ADP-ribose deacetylase (regulator of RNase III)